MAQQLRVNPITGKMDLVDPGDTSILDTYYLRLDCSNSPLVGNLGITGNLDISGLLAVGNLATTIANSPVYVYHAFDNDADNRGLTATIRQNVPPTAPNYPATLRFEMNYYGVGVQAYRLAGIYGATQVMPGAGNVDGARGLQGTVRHRSTSIVGSALGGRASIEVSGGGTINIGANFGVSNLNISAGTIGDLAGVWVENPQISGTGAVTRFYGVYLPNFTGPGTSWGIYQAGTNPNRFGGDVELQDDKTLWFDTANTIGLKYSTAHTGLYCTDDELSFPGAFWLYANTAANAAGNWEPYIYFANAGNVLLQNTLQGNAGAKYFKVNMTDGLWIADGQEIRWYEPSEGGNSYVGFEAPTLAASLIWTLPDADGSIGQVLKTDGSGTLSFVNKNTKSGFVNTTDSTLDLTTNRFTINPAVTSFDYYVLGTKYTVSSSDVVNVNYVDLADTEGVHYIYYDGATLTVAVNPTDSQIAVIFETKASVSIVYWDATNNVGIYVGEERHGFQMDGRTHSYLHFTRGLQYFDGLALNTIDADQDGSLDAHAQFGIDAGDVEDEDLSIAVSAIGSTDGMNIYYRDGANGDWRRTTQANFAVKVTGTGRLAWNELTGGAWQLTEVTNGNFVLCHIFATTEKDNPMVAIIGQVEYTKVKDARVGATTEVSDILLGNLPTPEIRPIATVIFQTQDSYTNSINARIRTTDEGEDYVDWRVSEFGRGAAAGDHGSLAGLSDDDHTQYLLADGTRALAGAWNMASKALTNVNTDTGDIANAVVVGGVTASNLVDKSASETIAGEWTYSTFPITPSAAPDANYEVANKKYVDDNAGGAGEKDFGDGSDGNVVISGGNTLLNRDMYYETLTLDTNATLDPEGFKIYAKTSITIEAGSKIVNNGAAGGNGGAGGNASNGVGGAAGSAGTAAGVPNAAAFFADGQGGSLGGVGGTGTVGGPGGGGGAGSSAGGIADSIYATGTGTAGSTGGVGGNDGLNLGGAPGAGAPGSAYTEIAANDGGRLRNLNALEEGIYWDRTNRQSLYWRDYSGNAGSGGGGGGAGSGIMGDAGGGGGGAGGGGANGGIVFVASPTITNAGAIQANAGAGGNGGNGGNGFGVAFGAGGGGGGAGAPGGSGGTLILVYNTYSGAGTKTASAGAAGTGGTGGSGTGAGSNGANGTAGIAGNAGLVLEYN